MAAFNTGFVSLPCDPVRFLLLNQIRIITCNNCPSEVHAQANMESSWSVA